LQKLDKVIEQRDRVTLSDPDWDIFFEALTNPPKQTWAHCCERPPDDL
jgi:uncharacterized protein (DUF1778 family)